MRISSAYHRARLREIGISPEEFSTDPVKAMERAATSTGFEAWAERRLASASSLRAIFDDVQPAVGARAFGIAGHRIFARQLQILG